MDCNRIAFITCVNDQILYKDCLHYINQLIIPPGYSIEIVPIYGANSMTSGYNDAMRKCNAKYKVYLHQDVFILNQNFVKNFLSIFQNNHNIGMIGMIGTQHLPPSGVWSQSPPLIGKVLEYRDFGYQIVGHGTHPHTKYYPVQVIDGLIMVTQHDISWNENMDGFHFYDVSHSIDFLVHGYQIVVPHQDTPWVMHYLGEWSLEPDYWKYRDKFLEHYSFWFQPPTTK
jgi:hypothetical protein